MSAGHASHSGPSPSLPAKWCDEKAWPAQMLWNQCVYAIALSTVRREGCTFCEVPASHFQRRTHAGKFT